MIAANHSRRTRKRSVLVICRHPLLREGLGFLISQDEDLHLVGLVADVSGALDVLGRKSPDVVVIVHASEHQGCTSIVERLRLDHPDLPILVISPDLNSESVQAVLEAGAMGYLSIDVSQDELVRGIYAISRGEIFLESPVVVNLLSRQIASSSAEISLRQEDFSSRELEVLSCLTRGMTDRDIAQALFISVRTVQTHLAHIYEKMGVHSRTEAALLAVRVGWLSAKPQTEISNLTEPGSRNSALVKKQEYE